MKTVKSLLYLSVILFLTVTGQAQQTDPHIYSKLEVDSLLTTRPERLKGYWPNQTGYLTKIEDDGSERIDTTFTVEQIKIQSDGFKINGWLYLPLGNEKHPLIILTNGGGDDSRPIRNFSDWIAPILAHCGYAALVHDKRGTGESEGDFSKTTYNDYITDAGNCAKYFSKHPRVDSSKIGVAGASEGGRIAVIAASRYPEIKFAVSFAGTVVSAIDDRIYAQKGWLKSLNLPDSTYNEVLGMHEESIRAWASNDSEVHKKVNKKIFEMRNKYPEDILPFTKNEMDSISAFAVGLPTWNSLPFDFMSEMAHFEKTWLAIFGEEDIVVPTAESVKNIIYYMSISKNENYNVAVIPYCGHVPVNTKTKRMIRLDNMIINWLETNLN